MRAALARTGPGRRHLDLPQRGGLDERGAGAAGRARSAAGSGCAASASPRNGPARARPAPIPRRAGGVQKGGLAAAVAAVRAAHPAATVTLWAEDEHRLGLLPVVRRVWAPKGQRPIAQVERHYEWLYVYGFVRPSTGQSWWCLLPTVTTDGDGRWPWPPSPATRASMPTHRAVLVVDQAGWHTSPRPGAAGRASIWSSCPPASPELQPAERLWALVDEPVANRAFPDLDALEAVLVERCRTPGGRPRSASKPTPTSTGGRQSHPRNPHVITRIPYKRVSGKGVDWSGDHQCTA